MNNSINLVLCCDENYVQHAAALLASVAIHNKSVDVFLLTNCVTELSVQCVREQISSYKGWTLNVMDCSDIKKRLGVSVPNTISISAYIRLFLSSVLPQYIEKVIYLDCDIIVTNSLEKLWCINLGEDLIAGVMDVGGKRSKIKVGLPDSEPYLNSGMLLINLKEWRNIALQDKMLQYLQSHEGNVFHHDQGIINAVCCGRKMVLPPKFNVMTAFFDFDYNEISKSESHYYSKQDISIAKSSPVIVHFTPSLTGRPWFKGCSHIYAEKYLAAKRYTAWSNRELQSDNRPLRLKFLSWSHNNSTWLYKLILFLRAKLMPNKI